MPKKNVKPAAVAKTRKRRKTMSKEQRAAAAERLAKARAAKGQSQNLSLHESIRDRADDHPISPAKVKQWLKVNKEALNEARKDLRNLKHYQSDRKAIGLVSKYETYVANMETYLRTGQWLDMFYGEQQEHRVQRRCLVLAYNRDGSVKREIGVIYPDVGLYTKEMYEEDNQ
jgi:hypothetical protein